MVKKTDSKVLEKERHFDRRKDGSTNQSDRQIDRQTKLSLNINHFEHRDGQKNRRIYEGRKYGQKNRWTYKRTTDGKMAVRIKQIDRQTDE